MLKSWRCSDSNPRGLDKCGWVTCLAGLGAKICCFDPHFPSENPWVIKLFKKNPAELDGEVTSAANWFDQKVQFPGQWFGFINEMFSLAGSVQLCLDSGNESIGLGVSSMWAASSLTLFVTCPMMEHIELFLELVWQIDLYQPRDAAKQMK